MPQKMHIKYGKSSNVMDNATKVKHKFSKATNYDTHVQTNIYIYIYIMLN